MFPFFGAEYLQNDLVDLAFIIALIGGLTAVMAAAIAFVQHDLKKGISVFNDESTSIHFHRAWVRHVPCQHA